LRILSETKRTIFFDRHLKLGAKMVAFAGWNMPLRPALKKSLMTRLRLT